MDNQDYPGKTRSVGMFDSLTKYFIINYYKSNKNKRIKNYTL